MPIKEIFSVFAPLLLNPFVIGPISIMIAIAIGILIYDIYIYKTGTYYKITGNSFLSVRTNTGRYGEYLSYKRLRKFEAMGAKFLFNVYIPKENGETGEIDLLMISKKGVFVFESKNYSGWIFGSEMQKNWYQTLPQGRGKSHKELFYNPIMQNHSHIQHLNAFLGKEIPTRSIIVFSERCTLKNVQVKNNDIKVINRNDIFGVVYDFCSRTQKDLLSESDVSGIYSKLYPLTQVDEAVKDQHIKNIKHNLNTDPQPSHSVPSKAFSSTEQGTVHEEKASEDSAVDIAAHSEQSTTEQSALKCPRCSGDLILRTATKGANAGNRFYGCSNYPKCKYLQSFTDKE
ncbi:MAG: DNA-binding protein [Ruminococcaceae bacterium]|nr:DNA-binding protein [Oscillospiraceae bacterium]